jgi:hypothetical protein
VGSAAVRTDGKLRAGDLLARGGAQTRLSRQARHTRLPAACRRRQHVPAAQACECDAISCLSSLAPLGRMGSDSLARRSSQLNRSLRHADRLLGAPGAGALLAAARGKSCGKSAGLAHDPTSTMAQPAGRTMSSAELTFLLVDESGRWQVCACGCCLTWPNCTRPATGQGHACRVPSTMGRGAQHYPGRSAHLAAGRRLQALPCPSAQAKKLLDRRSALQVHHHLN